jgi:hypothetical protein
MTGHHAHQRSPAGKTRFGTGHIIGLFLFYSVLAFAVLAFAFFFIYTGFELGLVIALTLVVGAIATFVHVKAGRRTRIDTLVDRGP